MIVAENIGKTFKRKGQALSVLSGINLKVASGERVAILGKSGVGKSTLLHIIGTLDQPTTGTVKFDGEDVFKYSEEKLARFRNAKVGFVFQFHYLMLEFSALENVMMPGLIAGWPKRKAADAAAELLYQVGLSSRLEHKPGQLSGGEQQRVAIARALLMKPRLLLTDEMTGNLDPATGAQVLELLDKLHTQLGMAMVSVTHDEALAKSYPRVLRLSPGALA